MYYFSVKATQLGDYWSRINHALIYAQLYDESTFVIPKDEFDRNVICKQIYDVIDFDKKLNYFHDIENSLIGKYTTFSSKLSYNCVYFPTKLRWNKNSSKKICYSFDANFEKEKKTPLDITTCLDIVELNDYHKIKLGLPMSIHEIVKELAECEFLVTLDNGIAHIARSVGCPTILVQHVYTVGRGFPPGSCDYFLSVGTNDTINHIKAQIQK